MSGAGGVVRDSDGNWLRGFCRYLGHTNSLLAELWAVRDGLRMAKSLDITALVVELDAKSVLDLIWGTGKPNGVLMPIILDCRELSRGFSRFRSIHTFREGNSVADSLAKLGRERTLPMPHSEISLNSRLHMPFFDSRPGSIVYFDSPPGNALIASLGDRFGVTTPRFVRQEIADLVGD